MAPVEYLFERCRTREEFRDQIFSKGPGYLLYKVVDDCVDASFPMLGKMGHKLEGIEEDIFEGRNKEIVRDISNVKQEIINFRKIVRPQRAALRDLERTKRYIPEDLEVYFDDINDANERVWDLLENYKEVVEGLESTNESVISHRPERRAARAHRVQRDPAAADAHLRRLGHERPRPGPRARSRRSG